jgi:hypothetical protein
VLALHVSPAGQSLVPSHSHVCVCALHAACVVHATDAATPLLGSSVTQHTVPEANPSAVQSAASSHGMASVPCAVQPDGGVHA